MFHKNCWAIKAGLAFINKHQRDMEEKIRQLEKALRKAKKLNFALMLYILLISLGMTIYFNQM
jgi:hypothetical protein